MDVWGEKDRTPVVGKWDGEPSIVGKKSLPRDQVASFKKTCSRFVVMCCHCWERRTKGREKNRGVTDEKIMDRREALEEMEGG